MLAKDTGGPGTRERIFHNVLTGIHCWNTVALRRTIIKILHSTLITTLSNKLPPNSTTMTKFKHPNPVDNVDYRSAYGDMHAHHDAEMMKEHVTLMRSTGQIDEKMATELLKPLDKKREWTADYLSTLPTYTGQQPEMDSFETAEKHRRRRDKEQLKFIEGFAAGRIDEHGNPLAPDTEDGTSDSSQPTEASEGEARPATGGKTLPFHPPKSFLTPHLEPSPSPPPEPASASAQPPQPELQKRTRKQPAKVEPLTPLPGGRTYEGYSYNQLAAVGRERGIYTPGSAQGVRNALIQDDINVAQGLKRNFAEWKRKVGSYKTFKTAVPEELRTVAGGVAEAGEGDGDEV
jgi:hypothetical protein